MWRRELGYLLHPTIPVGDSAVVADVACGNWYANDVVCSGCTDHCSAWLVDVARTNPAVHVHGFDISSAQFPHHNLLPKNVEISTLDVLQPIPEKLLARYDVVHVGLLVFVVQHDDPFPLLENLLKLLSE